MAMSNSKVSTDILLSLTTIPLLIGVLGMKAATDFLQTVGQASEEIFRGDRLPVLNQPSASEAEP
jgi:hypothetical protein